MIQDAIKKVIKKTNLSKQEMVEVMGEIMSGKTTDAQIGAMLTALVMKGEAIEEIAGAAEVMREKAVRIPLRCVDVIDTCGTGGDGARTFNISTAAAFVAAGAGARVAKHGNRAVSSSCGSADVLKELGVNIETPAEKTGACIDTVGIGFLFAPLLHLAMKYAIGVRREIAVRTIFNILGPLTNPAGAKRQVLGIFDPKLTEKIASVLKNLNSEHVLVVHGEGLDEISPCGKTIISELKNGNIKTYEIHPSDFKMALVNKECLSGGDAKANALILINVLKGEKGPKRNAVILNGGAAIYVSGKAESLKEGIVLAEESIDSGAAFEKLERLKEFSNA